MEQVSHNLKWNCLKKIDSLFLETYWSVSLINSSRGRSGKRGGHYGRRRLRLQRRRGQHAEGAVLQREAVRRLR